MTPSGFVISCGGLLLSLSWRGPNKFPASAHGHSCHIPSNSVVAPDLPNSPSARIGDRGNIDVPNGEGSRPHERHKSDSEDDEDVYKGGHEVHYVVNRGEMACGCGCGGDYSICLSLWLLSSALLSQRCGPVSVARISDLILFRQCVCKKFRPLPRCGAVNEWGV
jgi:hypothetical protein